MNCITSWEFFKARYGRKIALSAWDYICDKSCEDVIFRKIVSTFGFDKCAVIYCEVMSKKQEAQND